MQYLSMSNTPCSRIASSHRATIRDLVNRRVGKEWCLFLDRDGVLNRQIVGDYVRTWAEFEWLPNAIAALKVLQDWAPFIVIVTNQQGIGKGLMSSGDIAVIHDNLRAGLTAEAVNLDAIQVCPHLESAGCVCRKPKPGLVLGWLRNSPAIAARLSVVVGDSLSDIQLARNVAAVVGGCASIYIGGAGLAGADVTFDSLWDFAVAVDDVRKEQGQ